MKDYIESSVYINIEFHSRQLKERAARDNRLFAKFMFSKQKI